MGLRFVVGLRRGNFSLCGKFEIFNENVLELLRYNFLSHITGLFHRDGPSGLNSQFLFRVPPQEFLVETGSVKKDLRNLHFSFKSCLKV